jgi:WD40 repeat protein
MVYGLEFINSETIVTGGVWDRTLNIWSSRTGENLRTAYIDTYLVSLQLFNNRTQLAVGTGLGGYEIYIFNVNDLSLVSFLQGHTDWPLNLVLIVSDLLVSSSSMGDTTIRFWNLATNECKFVLQGHASSVWGLKVVSSDVLASSSRDAMVKFWNITTGELIRTLTNHTDYIYFSIDMLLDTDTFLSGSGDKTI